MALRAPLFTNRNAPANPWKLPSVSFRIYDSPQALTGARLTLYECDYGDGVPKDDAAPTKKDPLAKFTIDATPGGKEGLQLAVTPIEGFVDDKLVAIKATDLLARADKALFVVDFGLDASGKPLALPVVVPRSMSVDDMDEADALELGLELEHGGQVVVSQLTAKATQTSTLPVLGPVGRMLILKTTAVGPAATHAEVETGAMRRRRETEAAATPADEPSKARLAQQGKAAGARTPPTLGRFNDAWRNPSIEPQDAPTTLEPTTLELLKNHDDAHGKKEEKDRPKAEIDVDGLRFTNFVGASERRKLIEDVLVKKIRHAWAPGSGKKEEDAPKADDPTGKDVKPLNGKDNYGGFATDDIVKAYFIVHEIGDGVGPFYDMQYTNQKIHADDRTKKQDSVQGYVNTRGTYATYRDFGKIGHSTVYEFTQGADWVQNFCIGIETVPLGSRLTDKDPTSEADPKTKDPSKKFASRGLNIIAAAGIFKYTHETLDALADLYVLASARAGHLLTVTPHVEMDRALYFSLLYARGDAVVANAAKSAEGWGRYVRTPTIIHGDPFGFDLEVFYEKITKRLNDLPTPGRRLTLPRGVRYGAHPARVLGEYPSNRKNYEKLYPGVPWTIGNFANQVHTFPHQSNPKVLVVGIKNWDRWNQYSAHYRGKYFWEPGWVQPTEEQLKTMDNEKEEQRKKAEEDRKKKQEDAKKAAAEKKAADDAKKAAKK